MADLFTLGLGLETTQLKQGTKELDTLTHTATTAEKNLKGVSTASNQAGKSFNNLRGQAANISYQLQDVAVQAQMGTNAFTILAQQGGQLFTPFSAALGLVATLGGALGGVAYQMMQGEDATKSYSDEIELLSQTVSVSERGLVSFSDQFGRLAAERPEVAISRLRGELERVSSIMNIVASDTSMLLSDFGASAYTIQSANAQLKDFTGTQEELAKIIGQETLLGFTDSANAAMMGVSRLQEQVVSLSEGFGVSQADALQLTQALANIDTPQGIIDASKSVSEMAMRLKGASPEIDRLNVKLNEQRVRAENLLYSQQTLNKAIGDTEDVANNTETALDAVSKANLSAAQAALALQDRIDVQRTSMEDGEAAAIRLATELSLGGNVSDELKEKVGNLAVEYYNLTEAEKAAQEQQRELAREQAQAAREQDQINSRAQKAVEQATLQSMTREEQIRAEAAATIALINASTDLNDVQKELAGIQVQENAQKEIAEGAEKALENVPSDFAMSVGEALASQDYSSFGNILASQAASFIGTAVTDAIGGSLGGVAGGLIGGAAGAVISQAISDYMAEDDIYLSRQASQGTGTVLGSIDAKSQSIANSLDYMTEGLDDLINVNTEGFKAMQALVDSIGGASNLVARDFDASGIATGLGLSSTAKLFTDITGNVTSVLDQLTGGILGDALDGVFSSVAGALFGKSSVTDEGINLLGGTIAEMIDEDVTQAYQTVTKKSLFKKSRSENYRFAGDAIEQQFDLTLEAMRDAVTTSAESLGMLPSEIQANLDAFTIEAQKISIKDLSAEEVADELEAVFSSIFDGLAEAVVPYVDDFQQAGEGAGETLSRLSTNLAVVDEMLAQLRLGELQGTTQEVLNLSEGVIDFFGSASGLATAFTGFVDEFATEERQLEILTDNLTKALGDQDAAILSSRDGVYDYIASLERLDGDNVERIANILSLTDSIDEYFDLLESVNESAATYVDLQIRLADAQDNDALATRLERERELADAVDDTARGLLNSIYAAEDLADATQAASDYEISLAQAMGDDARTLALTRAQELADAETDLERERLRSIYAATDLATAEEARAERAEEMASIQERLNTALGNEELNTQVQRQEELADASTDAARALLKQVYAAEDAEVAFNNAAAALSLSASTLMSQTDSAFAVLSKSIQAAQDDLTEQYESDSERIKSAMDTASDSISDLESVADSLKNAISGTLDISIATARAQLLAARNQIALLAESGVLPDSDTLDKLLSTVTGDNAQYYANSIDYYREQGRTANDIADLSELAEDQLTSAGRSLNAQEGALEALEDQYSLDQEALSSQLDYYANQLDISRNTYVAVLDVADAINNFEVSLAAEEAGTSSYSSSEIHDYGKNLFDSLKAQGATDDEGYRALGVEAINQGVSSAEVARAFGISQQEVLDIADRVGLPAFANGGTFSQGGLALVGERGPEIVNMPAGTHVSTANQTSALMDNSQLINLVQELIDKTIVQNGYAQKSYDILKRVSGGGNSFNTDTVVVASV